MTPSTSESDETFQFPAGAFYYLTLQLIEEFELPGHVVALQQVPGLHLPLVHHLQKEERVKHIFIRRFMEKKIKKTFNKTLP